MRKIFMFLCAFMCISLIGCGTSNSTLVESDTDAILNETELETENYTEKDAEISNDDSFDYGILVGLQKIKNCNISKAVEKDMHLTNVYDNSVVHIKAKTDIMDVFADDNALLCYDGGQRVTVKTALESSNNQFYDVSCANGICFLNTHEGGTTFKTLFEEKKWYISMYHFDDMVEIYSLNIKENESDFDNVLANFGKPDKYIVSGKHEMSIGEENIAYVYNMMVYEYDNYDVIVNVAEQYDIIDGNYILSKSAVVQSYIMSKEAVDDYMEEHKDSWGDAAVFKQLDIN